MNKLELNLSMYPIKYILSAVDGYQHIAKISVKIHEDMDKAELLIEPILYDICTIKNELCNYLIALIVTDTVR